MTNIKTQDSRIDRLLAALRSGDATQIEALCHPDMVVEDPESLPYGGVYRGFAGMCEVSAKLFAAVADWRVETERISGDAGGDDFVLVQRMTGRAASTGRPIDMSILERYTFRGGLLVSIRPYYWDTKAIIDLLGEK
jgi:ketosteroid isomerase-like protein